MADLTYQATLDDKISPALAKIQQQTAKTTETFGKFRTALASLAIGALVRDALQYADAINDISEATGMAIENVLGFSKAVTAAGGNAEKAQAAMVKFNLSIGDAAAGGLAAQDAFAQIGITLGDLRTLSEQDLFKKTIEGLSSIDDISKRAKLQNELLGKSLKGVNLKGLSEQYGAATEASRKYAEEIRKSAELQDKLDAAFSTLKLSILKAIEPIVTFINSLKPEQIDRFINAVVQIGGAAVAIVGVTKAFEGLAKVLGYLSGAVALGIAGFTSLGKTGAILAWQWGKAVSSFVAAQGVLAKLGQVWITVSTLFTKRLGYLVLGISQVIAGFAGVALAVIGINELIKLAFDVDPIDTMATKLEELVTDWFPGLAAAINKVGEAMGMGPAPSKRKSEDDKKAATDAAKIAEAQKKAAEDQAKIQREVQDALEKERKTIRLISEEFKKGLDDRAEQLTLETSLVGKSEQQKDLAQALFDLNKKTTDEVDKLTKAQALLTEEQKRGGLGKEYDAQIAKIQELSKLEQERLAKLVQGLADAKAAEQFRLYGIQQEYDLQDKLTALERERADLTLTDIEKKYRDIGRAADDAAKAAIRAEEARRGSPLSAQEAEQYYAKARAGTLKLVEAQKKLYDQSRTFDTGWQKAFKNYVDNARNAAQQAERVFEKFTSGIEDLLVNFAKTGKFEWKNFVNDMLEELLRSQIKQTMASVLQLPNPFSGSGGSVGDLFGGLFGSLMGSSGAQRGNSATTPMYVYDVSGAAGGKPGGLLGGATGTGNKAGGGFMDTLGNIGTSIKNAASSAWDGITGVIGDIGSGIGNVFGGIGSGISSAVGGIADTVGSIFSGGNSGGSSWLSDIGSGLSDMFGGFFANGGTIPAGKFGIVGERGPEFIGGPANITPMGSSNVTYNINAVDAASFKALVAADPGFIHAVAMKGAGSIPMGR